MDPVRTHPAASKARLSSHRSAPFFVCLWSCRKREWRAGEAEFEAIKAKRSEDSPYLIHGGRVLVRFRAAFDKCTAETGRKVLMVREQRCLQRSLPFAVLPLPFVVFPPPFLVFLLPSRVFPNTLSCVVPTAFRYLPTAFPLPNPVRRPPCQACSSCGPGQNGDKPGGCGVPPAQPTHTPRQTTQRRAADTHTQNNDRQTNENNERATTAPSPHVVRVVSTNAQPAPFPVCRRGPRVVVHVLEPSSSSGRSC